MELVIYKLDENKDSTGEIDKVYNIRELKMSIKIAKRILKVIPENTINTIFNLYTNSANNKNVDVVEYQNVVDILSDFIFDSFEIICPITQALLQHNKYYIALDQIENIDIDTIVELYIVALQYVFRKFIKTSKSN